MSVLNFFAALAILCVLWSLLIRRGTKKLTCSRSFSCARVFEGEQGELIEVVRNDGPYVIPWLRIESRISPYIRLGKQENLHNDDESYYYSCFTLFPYQQIRRRHRVTFLRRGSYNLGNAYLTTGDVLGVSRFGNEQQLQTPVLVFPRILDPEELPFPVSQMMGDMVRRNQLLKDPFLIRGIRDYQSGDPVRDIHWAATARTGNLQVRVNDSTVRTKLLVVLNVQHDDNQWSNLIQEKNVGPVEDAIRLAASVCVHTLRSGLSAGFATNMPLDTEKGSVVVFPADGTVQEDILLHNMARLRVHCAEKFISLLDSLSGQTGLDILVLSFYNSESIQESIAKLKAAGNRVSFYEMEGVSR